MSKIYSNITRVILIVVAVFLPIQQSVCIPKVWNIESDHEFFVGREDVLSVIYKNFCKSSEGIIALVGNSGTGKTRIARKYANMYRNNYDIVWWVQNNESMDFQFKKLMQNLYQSKVVSEDLCKESNWKNFLRETNLSWLIVFDNLNEKSNIENFLPQKHGEGLGHIITTSIYHPKIGDVVEVALFNTDESALLIKLITNEDDIELMKKVADEYYNFPINISLIATTIKNNPSMKLSDFLLLPDPEKTKLISFTSKNNFVLKTFNAIKKESINAYRLMEFISVLNNEDIPDALLRKWFVNLQLGSEADFITTKSVLEKYMLLKPNKSTINRKRDKQKLYFVHEFIVKEIRKSLSEKIKQKNIECAITAIAEVLSNKEKHVLDYDFYYYLQQIIHLIDISEKNSIINNNSFLLNINLLEYHQLVERNPHKAKELSDKMEKVYENLPEGKEHARYYANLAGLNWWLGNIYEGIPCCEKAIKIYEKGNRNTNDLMRAKLYLISHYNFSGQIEKASQAMSDFNKQYALFLKENNSTSMSHYTTALFHQIYATTFLGNGRPDVALEELEKAFISLNKLASMFGSYEKFMARYTQYFTNYCELFYLRDGVLKSKIDIVKLHESSMKFLNEKHRLVGYLKVFLGYHYFEMRQYEKSINTVKHGINILDSWYETPNKHREQAIAHIVMADIYMQLKKHDKCLDELLLAENIYDYCYDKNTGSYELFSLYKKIIIVAIEKLDNELIINYSKKLNINFGSNPLYIKEMNELLIKSGIKD